MLQLADDEDEYIGSLDLCSIDEDYDENCDVTAVDRFHGLRVAHPIEAHTLGQGITVGRDASCGIVLDEPSVGYRPQFIVAQTACKYTGQGVRHVHRCICTIKEQKAADMHTHHITGMLPAVSLQEVALCTCCSLRVA